MSSALGMGQLFEPAATTTAAATGAQQSSLCVQPVVYSGVLQPHTLDMLFYLEGIQLFSWLCPSAEGQKLLALLGSQSSVS